MVVLGGGVLGKYIGQEGGVLMTGICALIKETPEDSLTVFQSGEGTTERWQSATRKTVLTGT